MPKPDAIEQALLDALAELAERTKLEIRRECQPQVDALIDAGWRFELPAIKEPEPWQWYWRRPPKRKTGKGRRFASTNQAFNALQRASTS